MVGNSSRLRMAQSNDVTVHTGGSGGMPGVRGIPWILKYPLPLFEPVARCQKYLGQCWQECYNSDRSLVGAEKGRGLWRKIIK